MGVDYISHLKKPSVIQVLWMADTPEWEPNVERSSLPPSEGRQESNFLK